ncbi:ATP-binding cassette sub-family A member 3-like [Teleopsis dalmanni]|uniref:ATP-binding cassette sub-family A member 3-like n=1 Tax=Teleopsis dalmanni TaxID=139649 RepID=UPI0018CF2BD1|nr:ATP-binding cassette sub-family A member 3-like [Teleopsis dalmanni]
MGSFDSFNTFDGSFSSIVRIPPFEEEDKHEITNFQKFSLHFWKVSYREFRQFCFRVFVVFLPTIFITFFVLLRFFINVEERYEVRYDPISFENEWVSVLQEYEERKDHLTIELLANKVMTIEESIRNFPYNVYVPQLILCFAPNTQPGYVRIMEKAAKKLNSIDVIGFETCKQLRESMQINFYLAGVCFNEEKLKKSNTSLHMFPKHLNYSLVFPSELRQYHKSYIGTNWNTNNLYDIRNQYTNDPDESFVMYVREGFISLQQAVTESYLALTSKKQYTWVVSLRQFPYCKHDFDGLLTNIRVSLPLAIIMGFIYPVMNFSKNIIVDDKSGLRSVLKIMGIPFWIQTLSYYFNGFLNTVLASFFLTLVLKIHWNDGYGICTKSSWSALIFLMLAYSLASLSFYVLIMSITSHTKSANFLLATAWILTYLPYTQRDANGMKSETFICMYLFSNTAMAAALDNLLALEEFGRGFQWDNMFKHTEIKSDIIYGNIILIMFGQSIVYLIIALFMDKVNLYGKIKRIISATHRKYRASQVDDNKIFSHPRNTEIVEIDLQYKRIVIEIRKITKIVNNIRAISNVTMNICQGDITVLMGHNNSGKTTLLSMIVGLIRPTRGTIVINGYDINDNPGHALCSVGISVGNSTLINNLTVREQLSFFCALKGINDTQNHSEVEKYVRAMNLEEKGDTVTQDLSTGMKQYLKVSSALIGGSKIVVLNEPSMGLDMEARKLLWKLLLNEKTDRTIFLTTQSCEEADALGDRIGILSGGELQCYGSSYFLKNLYSTGYRLFLIKDMYCDIEKVTEIIRKFIPNIQPEYVLGNEISYALEEKYIQDFNEILKEIYEQQQSLSIITFSICESSLYDVFMQRGTEYPSYGDQRRHSQIMSGISFNEDEHQQFDEIYNYEPLTGFQLWFSHFYALVIKRVAFQYYHIALTIIQLVAPIVFPLISLALTNLDIERQELRPITFDLDQYQHSITIISVSADLQEQELDPVDLYRQNLFWKRYEHIARSIVNENAESFFIKKQSEKQDFVNHDYLIGASFEDKHITAWFNNYPLHTAPLSLNTIHNALAQYNDLNAKVTVTLDPLPFSTDFSATLDTFGNQNSIGFFLPRYIALCFSIIWPFRCIFFTKERSSGFKILQSIAGLSEVSYWMSSYLTNIVFVIFESVIIVTINFYSVASYVEEMKVAIWFLIILVIAGISTISLTYLVSIYFKDFNTTYAVSVIFLLFNVVCYCIICEVLYNGFAFISDGDLYRNFRMLLRGLPLFLMARGLEKAFRNENLQAMCNDKTINTISRYVEQCRFVPNCCSEFGMLQWQEGILSEVFCLTVLGIISWALIYILYYRGGMNCQTLTKLNSKLARTEFETHHKSIDTLPLEKNIINEIARVEKMTTGDQFRTQLVCAHLTYSKDHMTVIKNLTFALQSYECLGILGMIGSGKSTLLKLLAGKVELTEGHIRYEGLELKDHQSDVYKMIGYMADVNLCMDEYTGWQILKMMSLLRGVPRNKIPDMINIVAKILGFHHYLYAPVKCYSNGFKIRLNFAVALMGKTKILLLDNPTQGLDGANRRIVYNLICHLQEMGRAIVFCSIRGNECELIANKIAILHRGRFRALGTLSSLNATDNDVFILKIKIRSSHLARISTIRLRVNRNQFFYVESFMDQEYPNSFVKGIWGNVIVYAIPFTPNVTLSEIFSKIRRNHFHLRIEDFQISINSNSMFFIRIAEDSAGVLYNDES